MSATATSERPENGALVTGIKVLYVEDNPAILRSITRLLELEGFVTYVTSDRHGALAHLQGGACPDVLVCDYGLLDDDGVQVISCIRAYTDVDIPAIILTGDPSYISEPGILPRRTVVLCKPFGRRELAAAIRAIAEM